MNALSRPNYFCLFFTIFKLLFCSHSKIVHVASPITRAIFKFNRRIKKPSFQLTMPWWVWILYRPRFIGRQILLKTRYSKIFLPTVVSPWCVEDIRRICHPRQKTRVWIISRCSLSCWKKLILPDFMLIVKRWVVIIIISLCTSDSQERKNNNKKQTKR